MGHLENQGFSVKINQLTYSQLVSVKRKHAVPRSLYSCHTAVVQGYVIEGHVPADLIMGLLEDKPPLAGLGVPGMPIGSSGMEGPNPQPYEVMSFDRDGRMKVHARR